VAGVDEGHSWASVLAHVRFAAAGDFDGAGTMLRFAESYDSARLLE